MAVPPPVKGRVITLAGATMRFAEAARQPDGRMEMATLSMRLLLCAGLCFVLSACGTSGSNPQSVGSVGSSRAGCAGEIAAAPPAPAVTSKAITNHLAPDGSWQIRAPENLQPKPVDSNRDGYVLQLQEGSGLYPMLAVRVFQHPFEMSKPDASNVPLPFPYPKDLADREAKGFATDKGVTQPVLTSVVQLPAMNGIGAGKLIICLNQAAGYSDPHSVIVQYLIERFDTKRSGWDEYVVELTTTVERYLQDASMAEAAAKSFAFTK